MNTQTDIERAVADWLTTEAHVRAPRGILAAVAERVDRTPQRRRPILPWRVPVPLPALGLAVIGVLVLVVAGVALRSLSPVGPGATATASSAPSPRPAAPGPLESGLSYTFEVPVPFSFSVPAGWAYGGTSPYGSTIINDHQTAAVGWFVADNLFRDPCHWQQGTLTPPVGAGVIAMVTALGRLPGFTVTAPTTRNVGGLPAQSLTLVAKVDDRTCDGGQTKVWSWTPTGAQLPLYGGTSTLAVVDVGGTRVIVTTWAAASDPAAAADAGAIVDSTKFR